MPITLLATLLALAAQAQEIPDPNAIFNRAVDDFFAGRFTESADAFDEVAALRPNAAPGLWQRGIALYYAGRYEACREQFESHRTVNPGDVENAAWHFLCVAKLESSEAAEAALLPVGDDPRSPMPAIYEMFQGAMTPQQVLESATPATSSQFYAHLYLGLYFDATGNDARALEHIRTAADDRFGSGYMNRVAQVHLRVLEDVD